MNGVNLFTDLEGQTNPEDRQPEKKYKFIKSILKGILKFALFLIKHPKIFTIVSVIIVYRRLLFVIIILTILIFMIC